MVVHWKPDLTTLPALCVNAHANVDCVHCRVRALSLCAAFEPNELGMLDKLSKTLCFGARETLFEQDERAYSIFNITSGSVRLYKVLPDGRRQVFGFALPGDFLGLSLANRNAFSADALTATTAFLFSRKLFSDLVSEKPHVLRLLHEMVSHELSLAQDQIMILGCRTAQEKVVAFLIGLRKRWTPITGETAHVPLPMTRQDIGDFLGLTVETVSRMLTRLEREKAILIVPDGVRLLDVARLEGLAEC